MKKHWKKILLLILGLYLVYGIITLVPAYMENKEWERREQTAIEILNVTNDPNLSQYEKNARLWELHNIPDDGVVNKNGLRYEFSNNYSNKSNNSSNKLSRAQKKRINAHKKSCQKIKDIGDKYGFDIDEDMNEESKIFILNLYKYGDDYESFMNYLIKDNDGSGDSSDRIIYLRYCIQSESIGKEFNSKDYEVLQDIINILDIPDFSISNATPITKKSTINFDNGWVLDYSYRTSLKDEWFTYPYSKGVKLEFKKKL